MIYVVLTLLGLCFGSFVNALVWRLREGKDWVKERSECVHCGHELAARDLVPVLSWLWLKGRCRYCRKPVSAQYPLVELLTAGLFIGSYAYWPSQLATTAEVISFVVWLVAIVAFVAVTVYDIRWMEIPDTIIFPLIGLVVLSIVVQSVFFDGGTDLVRDAVVGLLVGGGIFYAILQLSDGKWIGGGDVKLGFAFGPLLGARDALIALYVASMVGAVFMVTLMALKRLNRHSKVPFGPFLVVGVIVARLFGSALWQWYSRLAAI